jgi:hypothetical protein
VSDILKPLSAAVAAIAAVGASAVTTASANAASLPPALANLAAGNVLAGIVVERSRSAVLLKTDKGLLQLTTNLPLKVGAEVVLEVQLVGAQLRFAIVSVDQRVPQSASADSTQELARNAGQIPPSPGRGDGRASPAASSTPLPLIGRTVTAVIIAPPETAGPSLGTDPIPTLLRRMEVLATTLGTTTPTLARTTHTLESLPLIPSTEALKTILTTIAPSSPEVVEALLATPLKSPAAPETTTGKAALPPDGDATSDATRQLQRVDVKPATASVVNAPAPEASVDPVMRSPKLITIRLLDVLAPTMVDMRPLSARVIPTSDSITLIGTVVTDDAPNVEIATPIGTLRLPGTAGVAIGAKIAFEVLARPHDPAIRPEQPLSNAPAALPQRTLAADPPKDWPALRELIAALPQDGDDGVLVPKPGPTLGPALLAFLTGLRSGGNAKAWLGSAAVDSLESSGRTRLLERLGDELGAQARAAAIPDSDGWQTMAVPILDGDRFNEVRFHIQKRRKSDQSNEESGSRFVVEATLSTLGPLQLDGLVRAQRIDLIVRTARPLPGLMRRNIEALFAQSLMDSTYRGGVSFRDAPALSAMRTQDVRGPGVIV